MSRKAIEQLLNSVLEVPIREAAAAFITDRRAQHLSPRTITAYSKELRYFCDFLDKEQVSCLMNLTANHIRLYLVELGTHRNAGGVHIAYRTIKTFTFWVESELDDDWRSPMRKVKAPKIDLPPLEPVSVETIQRLIDTCERNTFHGDRDIALMYFMFDTGVRAFELLALNLNDINMTTNQVEVREGKGHKHRTTYFGKKTKKVLRAYLRHRNDRGEALWVKADGERMTYSGLRDILRHRTARAGMNENDAPNPHDFRRAFAINLHRAKVSLHTIRELMGHEDLQVLQRYLKQTGDDLRDGIADNSPANQL